MENKLAESTEPPATHTGVYEMLVSSEKTDIQSHKVVAREDIDVLQLIMSEMPQAPAMETSHFFAGGMYCRRIEIPAGNIIVSKVHKTEHLFIGCSGELAVAGQGENYVLRSGDIIKSYIGTKRVVHALTDVVCLTVHKTDLQSVEGLEDELMEFDPLSKYDVNNSPKAGVLVSMPERLVD